MIIWGGNCLHFFPFFRVVLLCCIEAFLSMHLIVSKNCFFFHFTKFNSRKGQWEKVWIATFLAGTQKQPKIRVAGKITSVLWIKPCILNFASNTAAFNFLTTMNRYLVLIRSWHSVIFHSIIFKILKNRQDLDHSFLKTSFPWSFYVKHW